MGSIAGTASITGTLSTQEINTTLSQTALIGAAAQVTVQAGQFVFFAAFDGTNNDRANLELSGTKQATNVAQLEEQAAAINVGKELFSNSLVSDDYKGVRSLDWVDANRDGKITSIDPVFKELKVWQDVNGDGDNVTVLADGSVTLDPGELQSLSDLGITELDYVNGRFTKNGAYFSLKSQELEADPDGTRINAVQNGIVSRIKVLIIH